MAFANNQEQFDAVAAVFEELREREARLAAEVATLDNHGSNRTDIDAEIQAALGNCGRIASLAGHLRICDGSDPGIPGTDGERRI